MNRQAKGRAAAIVASITLIAGTVALGTVVKGHTARRVTTAGPPPAAPAPEPPTATVAPADAGAFPGFWPQATPAGAYENTVLAEVRDDNGTRLSPPGGSSVLQVLGEAGGGRARLAIGLPFAAPQTPSGIVVLSAGTGAGPTPDMSVVRVRFAAGAAGMAPGGAGCCGLSP